MPDQHHQHIPLKSHLPLQFDLANLRGPLGQAGVQLGTTVPRCLSNWRGTVGAVVDRRRSVFVRPISFELTTTTNVGETWRPPSDSKGKCLHGAVGVGLERLSGIWGEAKDCTT